MAKVSDVLTMLRPQGGWVVYGNDFNSIIYDKKIKPVTQVEFENALEIVDNWLIEQQTLQKDTKISAYKKLGLTDEEIQAIL